MNRRISIIIPTLGERKVELTRLFDSIAKQDYKNIEVVVIAQGNQETVKKLCDDYSRQFYTVFIATNKKGLSRARNIGLKNATGDIIVLSDDDCWYEDRAIGIIESFFEKNSSLEILLTKIYDPINKVAYKTYPKDRYRIKRDIDLLSKSSIEIAFKRNDPTLEFDELFGLGGIYVAGEENDFLVRSFRKNKVIQYEPVYTVFHQKKNGIESNKQIIAKGAFYSKNFGFIVSNLVLFRDFFIKKQDNYRWFWHGYYDYKKQNKRNN